MKGGLRNQDFAPEPDVWNSSSLYSRSDRMRANSCNVGSLVHFVGRRRF